LFFVFAVSDSTSQIEVNKHLEMGRDLLSRGQLQDALSHYHAAVGEFEFDIFSK
jgi:DnaJ family protein C protein 3